MAVSFYCASKRQDAEALNFNRLTCAQPDVRAQGRSTTA
jgi:hypothetical protein